MSSITIRVDEKLKQEAYQALQKLNVTPSDFLRQTLEYVAQNHKLPFKPMLLNDDEQELLNIIRERLANPQPVSVNLNEL